MCLFIHILLFDGVFLCHRPIVLYSTLSAPFYLAPIFVSILFLSHTILLVSLFLTTILLGILFYPILLFHIFLLSLTILSVLPLLQPTLSFGTLPCYPNHFSPLYCLASFFLPSLMLGVPLYAIPNA